MYTTYITAMLRAAWQLKAKFALISDFLSVSLDFVGHGLNLSVDVPINHVFLLENSLDSRARRFFFFLWLSCWGYFLHRFSSRWCFKNFWSSNLCCSLCRFRLRRRWYSHGRDRRRCLNHSPFVHLVGSAKGRWWHRWLAWAQCAQSTETRATCGVDHRGGCVRVWFDHY